MAKDKPIQQPPKKELPKLPRPRRDGWQPPTPSQRPKGPAPPPPPVPDRK